ncbi:MAG TPA: putative lipid II flippase FtsW [Verrucomicrobia bacterium]|nr:putative lipid II flippase FtsW [Verrucomicrobiota bacterium]
MRRAAPLLTSIIFALVVLGLVMLYSTSSARTVTPHFYLQRQASWLLVAVLAGVLVAYLDYHVWQRLVYPLAFVTILLLVLVLIPGIGTEINGSSRWLRFGGMGFQPSELAKLLVIVGMSVYMSRFGHRSGEFKLGFFYPILAMGAVCALVALEPDYGTTVMVGLVGMAVMFAGGTRLFYVLGGGTLGMSFIAVVVYFNRNRLGRILAFLYPDENPVQAYHLNQSLSSFYLGGALGVGLGNSIQKRFYLPEAHTDFILAIIAEELGLIATMLVLLLFVGYFLCGMTISARAPDPFGRLLGFGVTMMICMQAAINMVVVTGLGPTKGLPLPFISYGGSSLVLSIMMSAVLLSIARTTLRSDEGTLRAIKDRGRHV